MYCPMCGDKLKQDGETFTCMRGELDLTVHMARLLHASFVERSVPPKQPVAIKFRMGGTWFCPGCGVQMQEASGTNGVICPKCGGNLGPFLYELIEFNTPHRNGDQWR